MRRHRLLVVALTATLAALLVTNPRVVDAAQQLTGKDIKNGSLTGKDVKDGSLTAKDLKAGMPAGPPGAPGPAGTAWQSVKTAYGTGGLSLATTATSAYVDVPGLTQTVSVPAGATVVVESDGGMHTTSTTVGQFASVLITAYVDGHLQDHGLFRAVTCPVVSASTDAGCGWSFTAALPLPAGSHTVTIRARTGSGATSNVIVSGNGDLYEGELTVTVLKS